MELILTQITSFGVWIKRAAIPDSFGGAADGLSRVKTVGRRSPTTFRLSYKPSGTRRQVYPKRRQPSASRLHLAPAPEGCRRGAYSFGRPPTLCAGSRRLSARPGESSGRAGKVSSRAGRWAAARKEVPASSSRLVGGAARCRRALDHPVGVPEAATFRTTSKRVRAPRSLRQGLRSSGVSSR
jgi:hypothetical protein